MPPLPYVAGVLKVSHHFTIGVDTNAMVRLHHGYSGPAPSDATCLGMSLALYTYAAEDLVALFPATTQYTKCEVLDLSGPTAGYGETVSATAGTLSGEAIGAGSAFLVSNPIARRYRGGKPRSYWPFGSGGVLLNANTWETGFASSVLSALDTFRSHTETVAGDGTSIINWCSVSYYAGFTSVLNPITGRTKDVPKVRTGSIPVDVILEFVPSVKVASQRRRNSQKR